MITNKQGQLSPYFELALTQPEFLSGISAWEKHIPFALTLIALLKPSIVVELGTHAGDSFCAMCQAISATKQSGHCYAIDTWRGDEHSGAYTDEIYTKLSQHQQQHYPKISTLIRDYFDNAVSHFEDASIDLLHIDGLHTYTAVKHDFETWLPKLSKRAVVLFHDTQERQGDFGVWQFWGEISSQYPNFEFSHGHGLGMLCVGPEQPDEILSLIEIGQQSPLLLREFFSQIGEKIPLRRHLVSLQYELENCKTFMLEQGHHIATQADMVRHFQNELAQTKQMLTESISLTETLKIEIEQHHMQFSATREELNASLRESILLKNELTKTLERLDNSQATCAQLAAQLRAINESTSWKITAPFRSIARFLGRQSKYHME